MGAGVRKKKCLVAAAMSLVGVLGLCAPGAAYTRPGLTRMVSLSPDGMPQEHLDATGGWDFAVISDDARYVAFPSDAVNLVTPDRNPLSHDQFIRNLRTGQTELVDVNSSSEQADLPPDTLYGEYCCAPHPLSLSATGKYVAF